MEPKTRMMILKNLSLTEKKTCENELTLRRGKGKLTGSLLLIWGDARNISGNVDPCLIGDVSGLIGDISGIHGYVSQIAGDVTDIVASADEIYEVLRAGK